MKSIKISIFLFVTIAINAQTTSDIRKNTYFPNFKKGIVLHATGTMGFMHSKGINDYLYDQAIIMGADEEEKISALPMRNVTLGIEPGYRWERFEINFPLEIGQASKSDNIDDRSRPSALNSSIKINTTTIGVGLKVHQNLCKEGKTTLYEGLEIRRRNNKFSSEYKKKGIEYKLIVGVAFNNQAFNVRPHVAFGYAPLEVYQPALQKDYNYSAILFNFGINIGFCAGRL